MSKDEKEREKKIECENYKTTTTTTTNKQRKASTTAEFETTRRSISKSDGGPG